MGPGAGVRGCAGKERALEQSTKLSADVQKQLEIGTMAPLDVVSADSTVATDKQALISSQSSLNYQQQIIKQAIARNLNDPALVTAPVIPTDRVSLDPIPEEQQPVEELVQVAFQQRPELEQAVLTLRNDEITLKGARNALLPQVDIFALSERVGRGRHGEPKAQLRDFFGGVCPAQHRRLRNGAPECYSTTRLRTRASGSTSRFRSATSWRRRSRRGR